MSFVRQTTTVTFPKDVLQAQGPVLGDFYATWCPPCRALAPHLEQIASEFPLAAVVKVNIDEEPQLASLFQIRSVPTLILFDKGQPVQRFVGADPMALRRSLMKLLAA